MSKAVFAKNFGEFLRDNVGEFEGLKNLVYVQDNDGEEYLYVNYNTRYAQKRICVTADSEWAMMKDFMNNIDKGYLAPDKVNREIWEQE